MKTIKRIVVVLLIVALLAVGIILGQKNSTAIPFDLGFTHLPAMPLGLLVCIAVLVGFTFGMLLCSVRLLGLRMRVRQLKRQVARLSSGSKGAPQVDNSVIATMD